MNRQFCTVAILTTLGVLSFTPVAKAGLTQNGTSIDGSTIDRAPLSLQPEDPASLDFYGSNLNGTSLDGSTLDCVQSSLQSDDPANLDFQQNESAVNETADQNSVTANE